MPFFDFHIHPTLKSLLTELPSKLSPWQTLDTRKIPEIYDWCKEFAYILRSQASLSQLVDNELTMVCIALFAPEKAMLMDPLIQGQKVGSLGIFLNQSKISKVINGELQPYNHLMTEDLNTIFDSAQFGITNKSVTRVNEFNNLSNASDQTIMAVFSVEGCHCFSSALGKYDVEEIISNIDDLRNKIPLISINLTHLEQSPLCNHAFGMLYMENELFKPTGQAISDDGVQVLKHIYDCGIMVDIKHMSLGARRMLYNLRKSPAFAGINTPLVCTHAGFTGISMEEIPDYILSYGPPVNGYMQIENGKPVKYGEVQRPSFNASSINLYDEDIMEILYSEGMIGLSLDKRILGFQEAPPLESRKAFPVETEYISLREKDDHFPKPETGKAFLEGKCLQWNETYEDKDENAFMSNHHLDHFMAHIIHIMMVAKANEYDVNKALTRICIGSDFDGMINPISCCDTVDDLICFKKSFETRFPAFAVSCNSAGFSLPADFDIYTFSEQLFYENGKNFVMDRLMKMMNSIQENDAA